MRHALRRIRRSCYVALLALLWIAAAATADSVPSRTLSESGLRTPAGVAVHGQRIYLADFDHHRILVLTSAGEPIGSWGEPGDGPGQLHGPSGVAVADDGTVFVAEFFNHRVQSFSSDGVSLARWGSRGFAPGQFDGPAGIAVSGHEVFVTDLGNDRVQRFDAAGKFLGAFGQTGGAPGQLREPWGIALAPNGDLIVADHGNNRVQQFNREGYLTAWWGAYGSAAGHLLAPMAIAVDARGDVYVSDLVADRMQRFTSEGVAAGQWNNSPADAGLRFGLALSGDRVLAANASCDRLESIGPEAWGDPATPPALPLHFTMSRASPNPGHGATTLRFGIPATGRLRVEIFSVDGRRVRSFGPSECAPGEHLLRWDGRSEAGAPAAAGLYFVRGRFDDGASERVTQGRIVRLP